MQILLKGFQCLRCGHQWKPRKKTTPVKCPACDAASWQIPPGETMPPHLEEVFQFYEVPPDQRAEIVRYAAQYSGVAQALLEVAPELEKVFGETRRRLDLFQFDDNAGEERLLALVLVKDYPEDALGLVHQVDKAMFPKVSPEVRRHLNFTVDLEDDYPI